MPIVAEPSYFGVTFVRLLRAVLVPFFWAYLFVVLFRYPLLASLHLPYFIYLPIIIIALAVWLNWLLVGLGICTDPLTEDQQPWKLYLLVLAVLIALTSSFSRALEEDDVEDY